MAIPLLALMPLLAAMSGGAPSPVAAGHADGVLQVHGWMRALLVVGAVAFVILAGRFLTRPVFRFVAMARMPEIQTAAAVLLVVAIALLMNLLGFSAALGTFLAGVVLADSEYRHELESTSARSRGCCSGCSSSPSAPRST